MPRLPRRNATDATDAAGGVEIDDGAARSGGRKVDRTQPTVKDDYRGADA